MVTPIEYRVTPAPPPCSLEDGLRMMHRLKDVAYIHGFMLALYGSITTHPGSRGRDVDMLAVPWRPVDIGNADSFAQQAVCLGFALGAGPNFGSMGTVSYALVEATTGKMLDLQFREVRFSADLLGRVQH